MKKLSLIIIAAIAVSGCTDAGISKLTNFGKGAYIKCYSGTALIYDGESTGKVISENNSDGYAFKDAKTNVLTEVSGNCIIKQK